MARPDHRGPGGKKYPAHPAFEFSSAATLRRTGGGIPARRSRRDVERPITKAGGVSSRPVAIPQPAGLAGGGHEIVAGGGLPRRTRTPPAHGLADRRKPA